MERCCEGDGEEREGFWNDLARVVDRVGNGYRLCMLGDLNVWVGDRVRVGGKEPKECKLK